MLLVTMPLASVDSPATVAVSSMSVGLIVGPLAFVNVLAVRFRANKSAPSMSLTTHPLALVLAAIWPHHGALPLPLFTFELAEISRLICVPDLFLNQVVFVIFGLIDYLRGFE